MIDGRVDQICAEVTLQQDEVRRARLVTVEQNVV